MKLELFINFDGNCRQAVNFYAKVFKSEAQELMTFGEAPADPNFPVAEADKNKICYAGIPLCNMTLMFMDMPSGAPLMRGNNISPTITLQCKDEVTRTFNELKEGGEVHMELQPTFFSELYGMVQDKFGVIWQILYYECTECQG